MAPRFREGDTEGARVTGKRARRTGKKSEDSREEA